MEMTRSSLVTAHLKMHLWFRQGILGVSQLWDAYLLPQFHIKDPFFSSKISVANLLQIALSDTYRCIIKLHLCRVRIESFWGRHGLTVKSPDWIVKLRRIVLPVNILKKHIVLANVHFAMVDLQTWWSLKNVQPPALVGVLCTRR